ncbi:hypothetical protein CALK_2450 [Chitinivibrio alkaliphilus ACht1]|uniref:TIGR02757 family protein n=1 Tax=Chitinivibrio alkaliphilus ACht1 TaxID=1313304 RepID=U7D6M2_9BACT|nr:hypothetical protein CALK_2450 [Chitinivibrio alkaliphilus ACht1]
MRNLPCKKDREVFGLLAACLSYGRVESIIKTLSTLLELLENSPADAIMNTNLAEKRYRFSSFVYRFTRGEELAVLCHCIGEILSRYGSLEELYQIKGAHTTSPRDALRRFSQHFHHIAHPILLPHRRRGFSYLLSPMTGQTPAKRLNMFLRWMIRPDDGIDLGLWPSARRKDLIIPLDTHIIRAAEILKLTQRKSTSWNTAAEITECLRTVDPADPVRFDFSLCHWGMVHVRRGSALDRTSL